ncbi:MAG: DUF1573 domain-containing protein [Phycisphaerales bacterium]|nr:MAG: DUF1573 domain-containing protein [Phycisphaerales bacterium]
MSLTSRRVRLRGASASGVFALIVAGVLLLVLGYVIGQKSSNQAGSPNLTPQGVRERDSEPSTVGVPDGEPGTVEEPDEGPAPCQFDPPELDFGYVLPGAELSATVKVINVSDRPLTIKSMKSSCLCTTMEDLTGGVILPGGHIELTPVVEPRSWTGRKRDRITFVFNEYPKPVSLSLISEVTRAVRAEPAFLNAVRPIDEEGRVILDQDEQVRMDRLSGEFTLSAVDGRPFRILAVNGEEPEYVDYDPASGEIRTDYRLRWDISGYDEMTCVDEFGNYMPGWWVVETDHPDAPLIDLRVRHLCTRPERPRGAWLLDELRVVLGRIKAGEPLEFTMTLKWLRDAVPNDTIRRIVSESDQFEADLVEVARDGDMISCLVRIVPKADHRGLLYGVCRFYAYTPGHSAPLTVIAVVEE